MDRRTNLSPEEVDARRTARHQTRKVREYMEWLRDLGDRRAARPRSPQEELDDVLAKLEIEKDILQIVVLEQRRLDAEAALATEAGKDPQALEDAFIEVIKNYSSRKGLTYKAWRAVNVPAKVLAKGGLRRARS